MVKNYRKTLVRIIILTVVFVAVGGFLLWDHYGITRDFSGLKTLLRDTRYRAISKNEILAFRFINKKAVVTDRKTGKVVKTLDVLTLNEVNYDTVLGDNMIVFYGRGTGDYNKREHGAI